MIRYVIGTREAADAAAAERFASSIMKNPLDCFGLATGNSVKKGFYPEVLRCLQPTSEQFLSSLRTVNLDEQDWFGHKHPMKRKDPRTFRGFMDQHLFTGLQQHGFKIENAHFPSDYLPNGQTFKAGMSLSAYDDYIEQNDGVHTWVVGFGQGRPDDLEAAHVAFCEPEHFVDYQGNWWERGSYTAKLAMKTRRDNASYDGCDGKWQRVPNMAITVGPGTLLRNVRKELIILAYGENKAWPAFGALEGKVRPGCPASVVQLIGDKPGVNVYVYMDHAAAKHLKRTDRMIAI